MRTCYPARLTRSETPKDRRLLWHPAYATPYASNGRVRRHSIRRLHYWSAGVETAYTLDDILAYARNERQPARLIYATALADLRGGDTLIPVVQGQIKRQAYGQAVFDLRSLSARLERALEALATI